MPSTEFCDLTDLALVNNSIVNTIKSLVVELFGDFHENVVLDGVYFCDERTPATLYPAPYNQYKVTIVIPKHQHDNPLAILMHLSHELVHCLTPNGLPSHRATMLEEGLAEHAKIYLSERLFRDSYANYDFKDALSGKYLEAFNLVEQLIAHEGLEEMRSGIRDLRRQTKLPFAELREHNLALFFKSTPTPLLKALSEAFHLKYHL